MGAAPKLAARAHMEVWGGALLKEVVANGGRTTTTAGNYYADWAHPDFAWWRRLENPKEPSWNWDFPVAAALLWIDPGYSAPGAGSITITAWWALWLRLQVGDPSIDALSPHLGISRHFDGTETLSETYGAGRYGAVAAVRLWALLNAAHPAAPELLRLTGRYLEVLATLLALQSRPWTDPGYKAKNGRAWYAGPTWAPVGERSEASGLQCDQGPILEVLRGGKQTSKRSGWPAQMFARLAAQPGGLPARGFAGNFDYLTSPESLALLITDLAGIRLWSEQHWTRWPEGLLVWKPKRSNTNTPAIFWAWMDDSAKRMTIGYPYPAGKHRGKGASGAQGNCALLRYPAGGWYVNADGIDGGAVARMGLPVSGDPVWSILGDPQGFREEKIA